MRLLFSLLVLVSVLSAQTLPDAEPIGNDGLIAVTSTRIVDAATGEPIEGALLRAVTEPTCPVPGAWHVLMERRSDAEGWVELPLAGIKDRSRLHWMYVLADGYAPIAASRQVAPFPIRLHRGADIPVVVVDHLGKPAGGVRLGHLLGCGHTPDVRHGTTDLSGRATIPCTQVDAGELWPLHPEVLGEYLDLGWWRPGWPAQKLWVDPAPTIRGVLLDANGQPMSGMYVGNPQYHRGPWAMTDKSGRFELCGVEPGSELTVHAPDAADSGPPRAFAEVPARDRLRTIRCAADHGVEELLPPEVPLQVVLPENAPPMAARVVHEATGLARKLTHTYSDNPFTMPSGDLTLEVRDPMELLPWQVQEKKLDVTSQTVVHPLDLMKVRLAHPISKDQSLQIASATGLASPSDHEEEDGAFYLPKGEKLWVRLWNSRCERVIQPLKLNDEGQVVVPELPLRKLTLRVVNEEGQPLLCAAELHSIHDRVDIDPPKDDSAPDAIELMVGDAEDVRLFIQPRDAAYASRRAEISPEETQTVVLRRRSREGLFISYGGTNLSEGEVSHCLLGAIRTTAIEGGLAAFPWSPLRNGDQVIVDAEGFYPARTTLRGDGPWALKLPETSISISVASESGANLNDPVVVCADARFEREPHTALVTIKGPPVGSQTLWVSAPGYATERRTVDVLGHVRVDVRLRKQP